MLYFLRIFSYFFFSENNFCDFIYKNRLLSSLPIIGKIYQFNARIKKYLFLSTLNKKLIPKIKNSYLKNSSVMPEKPFKVYKEQINDSIYSCLPVNVISNNTGEQKEDIILDKGSIDGIEIDMGVLSPPNSICGIVTYVSKNFSHAVSLSNAKTKINVKLRKSKHFGILSWYGPNYRISILEDIPKHSDIIKGDIVETSEKSTIFPEGLSIGKVKDYELDEESSTLKIRVELDVDFTSIHEACIIKDFKKEQMILMKRTP